MRISKFLPIQVQWCSALQRFTVRISAQGSNPGSAATLEVPANWTKRTHTGKPRPGKSQRTWHSYVHADGTTLWSLDAVYRQEEAWKEEA